MFNHIKESCRQDLLNDMAEHRPILKNNQNSFDPRFGFTPKTGTAFTKTFVFAVQIFFNFFNFGVYQ